MPFCPNCRMEYQPQATRCADCDVALVEVLPPLPAPPRFRDEPTIVVHKARDEQEAMMLVAILEAQGIPVTSRSREVPGYNMPMPFGTAWADIEVFKSQAGEARELIAAYLNVPEPEVTVEEEERREDETT